MVHKLDPTHPLVWRSPSSLQFGVDPAIVVFDDVSETTERLLAALVTGVSLPGLTMLARGRPEERDEVLRLVSPILLPPAHPEPATLVVALSGTGRTVDAIGATLHGEGIRVVAASSHEQPHFAIVVGHYVLPPESHGHWLRRDVPHLPVVLTDTATVIGPLVRPGSGPCLHCLELHHRDADIAWPAIAAQLLGRVSLAESATSANEAAANVSRLLRGWVAGDDAGRRSERIECATGARTTRTWSAHPDCGCLGVGRVLDHGNETNDDPQGDAEYALDRPMRRLRPARS